MRNLIIIGNGFDLAHGLKTDYASFIADIKRDPEKYSLEDISDNFFLRLLGLEKLTNPNWSDIECVYFKILSHIHDLDYMMETYNPSYISTAITPFDITIKGYGVRQLNDDFQQVKEFLAKYLCEQEANFEKMENYDEFFKRINDQYSVEFGDTLVLNFNYTNTVYKYLRPYKKINSNHIPIHGELNRCRHDAEISKALRNPMIFGYAADDAESKRLLDENDSQFVRNIKKFNYMLATNESSLKYWLETSRGFDIYILGHSCGLSDKLILNQIFNSKMVRNIYPFYYEGEDGDRGEDNYFETMVNIDRIIDDYSKGEEKDRAFSKLISYPLCKAMPQDDKDKSFTYFFDIRDKAKKPFV